jgi:crotonobetainyl-CoA:carnitine CoA-transferase CaiB-like acyl-CoA transferase
VLERLGLGHPELTRSNPRLVYCSINGFGQSGPYAGKGAFDATIQAISGIMKMTGYEFSVYRHPPLLGEHTEEVFTEWLKN